MARKCKAGQEGAWRVVRKAGWRAGLLEGGAGKVRLGNVVEFGRPWGAACQQERREAGHSATSWGQGRSPAEPHKA